MLAGDNETSDVSAHPDQNRGRFIRRPAFSDMWTYERYSTSFGRIHLRPAEPYVIFTVIDYASRFPLSNVPELLTRSYRRRSMGVLLRSWG